MKGGKTQTTSKEKKNKGNYNENLIGYNKVDYFFYFSVSAVCFFPPPLMGCHCFRDTVEAIERTKSFDVI
jgi:hypothetical protein